MGNNPCPSYGIKLPSLIKKILEQEYDFKKTTKDDKIHELIQEIESSLKKLNKVHQQIYPKLLTFQSNYLIFQNESQFKGILKCIQIYQLILNELLLMFNKKKQDLNSKQKTQKRFLQKEKKRKNYRKKYYIEYRDQLFKVIELVIEEDYLVDKNLNIELFIFILKIWNDIIQISDLNQLNEFDNQQLFLKTHQKSKKFINNLEIVKQYSLLYKNSSIEFLINNLDIIIEITSDDNLNENEKINIICIDMIKETLLKLIENKEIHKIRIILKKLIIQNPNIITIVIFQLKQDQIVEQEIEMELCIVIFEMIQQKPDLITLLFQFFQNSSNKWITINILEIIIDYLIQMNLQNIYNQYTDEYSQKYIEHVVFKCYEQQDIGIKEFFYLIFTKLKPQKNQKNQNLKIIQDKIIDQLQVLFRYDFKIKNDDLNFEFVKIVFELCEYNINFLGMFRQIIQFQTIDDQDLDFSELISLSNSFLKKTNFKIKLENQKSIQKIGLIIQYLETLVELINENFMIINQFDQMMSNLFQKCENISFFILLFVIAIDYLKKCPKEQVNPFEKNSQLRLNQITEKYIKKLKKIIKNDKNDISNLIIQLENHFQKQDFQKDAYYMEELFKFKESSTNDSEFSNSEHQFFKSRQSTFQEDNLNNISNSYFQNENQIWMNTYQENFYKTLNQNTLIQNAKQNFTKKTIIEQNNQLNKLL